MFNTTYVISLAHRSDRLNQFWQRWSSVWPSVIDLYQAIDGRKCKPPSWWTPGGGAWGCYRSHLSLIERALNSGVKSLFIFEDDAVPVPNFREKFEAAMRHVPDDWGMIYLGGQHLGQDQKPPVKVNDYWCKPYNVNRTHAYGLRGEMIQIVYDHLNRKDWHKGHHIDWHYGRLHMRGSLPVYCVNDWLAGQDEGKSDIAHRVVGQRFWKATIQEALPANFAMVLGVHRSGSSCTAGVLHKLGVHLGNKLGGYESTGGFEAVGLAQICEDTMPFPGVEYKRTTCKLKSRLSNWINQRAKEAAARGTIAGGKYPHLCEFAKYVDNIAQDQLRVIAIDRPIEESVASLIAREPNKDPLKLETLQRFLHDAKERFLKTYRGPLLRVSYHELLADPKAQVMRISDFLDLVPTADQLESAINHVKPEKKRY